jgi:hypothetical protein
VGSNLLQAVMPVDHPSLSEGRCLGRVSLRSQRKTLVSSHYSFELQIGLLGLVGLVRDGVPRFIFSWGAMDLATCCAEIEHTAPHPDRSSAAG